MKIYNYSAETGHYTGEGLADPDPMQEGSWLVPACATTVPIPEDRPGYLTRFVGGRWWQEPLFGGEVF